MPRLLPLCVALSALLAGCVHPFTQVTCDSMARDAIDSLRKGDSEGLGPLLARPSEAERLVAEHQSHLPHGSIAYRSDDWLFPMPTYRRSYDVLPDASVDGTGAQPVRVVVVFLDSPMRIDAIAVRTPAQ